MIDREHAIDMRLSVVAISAQVAIDALLTIAAVMVLSVDLDTDGHCKDMQIGSI